MNRLKVVLLVIALVVVTIVVSSVALAYSTQAEIIAKCEGLYGSTFGVPNSEPFGPCQWDMAIINAGTESFAHATGKGVKVGIIDSGVDFNHPDIEPNLDVDLSCSFIFRRHAHRRPLGGRQWRLLKQRGCAGSQRARLPCRLHHRRPG